MCSVQPGLSAEEMCAIRVQCGCCTAAWECLTRLAAMTGFLFQCFWTKNSEGDSPKPFKKIL